MIDVWPLVEQLIQERVALGLEHYGRPLQTDNGRRAALDAIHEITDLLMYLTQDYFERFGERPTGTSHD